ncbi:MAG: PDZ domain-containing protein [Saprospiraceae bacterium]|nr:PDZ domain-containing protein [Saprospiraceae bacterium]
MNHEENTPTPTKKLNIWLPLLFSLILVAGMLIGTKMQSNPPTAVAIEVPKGEAELPPSTIGQGKLEELIRYIESRYVDDVNKDELVKQAIDNILFQLDPHSSYISAEQLREVNEQLEGSFDGIGIEFVVVDDTVMVVAALSGGPAEGAGILSGDKIVQIEDSLTIGKNIDYEGILSKLKGEKGSKVKLGVLRGLEDKLRHFTLTRDKISVHSVEVAYMLDDLTGYIKINRFSNNTYEDFMKSLEKLVDEKGMKHLVIDLRQNPGGYMQEATNILSQLFKDKDKLLVFTEGKNVSRTDYKSTGRSFYDVNNIAVLTDEGSASASEILAGAVQDWDRGVIIGRRTFGKGLVQEQYRLRDGSAIRLTVARYYTPSGRCIQKPYEGRDDYDDDLAERIENGELYDGHPIEHEDTTKFYTSGGRIVYSGGGIEPDMFVPLDSSLLNPYYIRLNQHVPSYAFRYIESHRDELGKFSMEDFAKQFNVTEAMATEFQNFAVERGEKRNERNWPKAKDKLKQSIKAGIARHLWSEQGYHYVLNDADPYIKKAKQVVRQENPLSLK